MTNLVKSDNPIARYLRETRAEIAKVAWPTIEEARNLSAIVIGVTVAMAPVPVSSGERLSVGAVVAS